MLLHMSYVTMATNLLRILDHLRMVALSKHVANGFNHTETTINLN